MKTVYIVIGISALIAIATIGVKDIKNKKKKKL